MMEGRERGAERRSEDVRLARLSHTATANDNSDTPVSYPRFLMLTHSLATFVKDHVSLSEDDLHSALTS
jgi:hypothetical protein